MGVMRSAALVTCVVSLLFAGPALGSEPQTLRAVNRERLILLVITPSGNVANTNISELIKLSDDALRRHTNLTADPYPQESVQRCRGKLSCIALEVRDDTSAKGRGDVRYMVLLSNLSQPGSADRLSAALVDLPAADAAFREVSGTDLSPEDAEARISEASVLVRPAAALLKNESEARAHIEKLFTTEFKAAFVEGKNWEPFGVVELEGLPAGTEIRVDGVSAGVSQGGQTRVADVEQGQRKLTLENPSYEPYAGTVEVIAAQSVTVRPDMKRVADPFVGTLRASTVWGGAALAAAGVGIGVIGLSKSSDAEANCISVQQRGGPAAPGCGGDEWAGWNQGYEGAGVNPNGGFRVVPVSAALVGGGAVMSLGTMLGDDSEDPIWPFILGVGAGALIFGSMMLLEGDHGFCPNGQVKSPDGC